MDIKSKQVNVIPMINHYIEEMGLHEIFDRYVPNTHNADIVGVLILEGAILVGVPFSTIPFSTKVLD